MEAARCTGVFTGVLTRVIRINDEEEQERDRKIQLLQCCNGPHLITYVIKGTK